MAPVSTGTIRLMVGLGSEGAYELLAPSLDGLLAKLTSQQFDKAWSDLLPA